MHANSIRRIISVDGANGKSKAIADGIVTGVRTEGLAYPLHGETLALGRARGVSNRIRAAPAAVSCDEGVLLIIETRGGNEHG